MKSIAIWLFITFLSSLTCFAEPTLDCEVKEFPQFPGQLVIIIEGNNEVKDMKLATPIDRDSYREYTKLGKHKFIFIWPNGLPIYPTLFFQVNGTELHYVPQMKASDWLTKSKDPV